MTLRAVLKMDRTTGEFQPRRRAATFPELTRALKQYLAITARLRRQCETVPGRRYQSSEELILFNATPVWADLGAMALPPMPPKQCFENAAQVARSLAGYHYTEGFALMDGSIPTHHAWLTGPDGAAADPTWPTIYRSHAEREPAKRWSGRGVYMGIAVDRDVHRRWIERTGYPNFLAVYDDDVEELLELGPGALQ
jgi:hypothetical protein